MMRIKSILVNSQSVLQNHQFPSLLNLATSERLFSGFCIHQNKPEKLLYYLPPLVPPDPEILELFSRTSLLD